MAKKVNILKKLSDFTRVYQGKVKKFPRYADLRNMLGLLYYLQGKSYQALNQFKKALIVNPMYEEAMINYCFVLYTKGERNKAIRNLSSFAKKKKKTSHWTYLALSILYFQNNDSKNALASISKAYKKNPNDPHTLIVAAICQYVKGDKQLARKLFKRAQNQSFIVEDRNKKYEIYDKGKFHLKNLENLYPYYIQNPFINDLFVRLSEEFAKANRIADSQKLITFALRRGMASSRMLNFLGIMALREKRVPDAVKLFQSSFTRDIHNAYPAIHLFFLYGEKGEWKKARGVLEEALRHNPNYADLHNYMGMFFADMDQSSQALKEFRKALKINPYYLDALYNLAHACEDANRFSEALETYIRICSLRTISEDMSKQMKQLFSRLDSRSKSNLQKKLMRVSGKKKRSNKVSKILKILLK